MHGKPEVVDPYLSWDLMWNHSTRWRMNCLYLKLGANLCLYLGVEVDGWKIKQFLISGNIKTVLVS